MILLCYVKNVIQRFMHTGNYTNLEKGLSMKRIYRVWDYDNDVVIEYKRLGECNGCGQCCLAYIEYDMAGNLIGSTDGCSVGDASGEGGVWHEVKEGKNRWFIRLKRVDLNKSRCPSLLEDNRCAYHTEKSAAKGFIPLCDIWPMGPEQVIPFDQCSYQFEEVGRWVISEL